MVPFVISMLAPTGTVKHSFAGSRNEDCNSIGSDWQAALLDMAKTRDTANRINVILFIVVTC